MADIGESDSVRATIRSFRLKKEEAYKIYLFRFCLSGGEWKQYIGPADVNREVEISIKRFGESRVHCSHRGANMTIFRACTIKRGDIGLCNCTDAEMQPCLSVVVKRYLNDLRELGTRRSLV